jgi:hypothetical protein
MKALNSNTLRSRIKLLILLFIIGLVISGLTAFPLEWELRLARLWSAHLFPHSSLAAWIGRCHKGVQHINEHYPFMAYGTDWLAFAHLVIAVVFVGPLRDPVKNKWVIEFGLIACVAVFPLALIAGAVRGIPWYWRLIDCSFGILGGALLLTCYSKVKQLEVYTYNHETNV